MIARVRLKLARTLTSLLPMTALTYKKQLSEEKSDMKLKVKAKLDPQFAPMSVVCRDMREATKDDGQDIVIAVEKAGIVDVIFGFRLGNIYFFKIGKAIVK